MHELRTSPAAAPVVRKAVVVVPTYNEAENVGRLIPEILARDPRLSVLVVDDNSPDGTAEVVKALPGFGERVLILERALKQGLGAAYIAGFQWMLANTDFDAVFEMDADFSHQPEALDEFLQCRSRPTTWCWAAATCDGITVVNWPLSRLILSVGANLYARFITGMPIKDCTGGFKCFRRATLEALPLDRVKSDGYSFQIEMNYHCWKRGLRIKEIPIMFVDRQVGVSKMSRAHHRRGHVDGLGAAAAAHTLSERRIRQTVKLAIVIVHYNTSADLARCLESLTANPPAAEHRIVVVDNASRDEGLADVHRRFPDCIWIFNTENTGYAHGCNLGIAAVDAEYHLVLNPDVVVLPGSLDALLAFADRHPARRAGRAAAAERGRQHPGLVPPLLHLRHPAAAPHVPGPASSATARRCAAT